MTIYNYFTLSVRRAILNILDVEINIYMNSSI